LADKADSERLHSLLRVSLRTSTSDTALHYDGCVVRELADIRGKQDGCSGQDDMAEVIPKTLAEVIRQKKEGDYQPGQ
jgi:hypothetical protein